MNRLLVTDPAQVIPENFLASTEDLLSAFAHLAGSRNPHSSQHRRDLRLAEAALSRLLMNIVTTGQLPPSVPVVAVGDPAPPPQQTAAGNAARTSGRRIAVEARGSLSRSERRQYCTCGQCKGCLDNLRWDRIFTEKFADPAYYGRPVVRHNSTLAGAR